MVGRGAEVPQASKSSWNYRWKANRPLLIGGSLFFIDVAFRHIKLAIEIDGRLYHNDSEVFESVVGVRIS